MQQISRPPEPLNAAQLAAVEREVRRVIAELNLRRWVVELVLSTDSDNPLRLVRDLYRFVIGTDPAEED
jgi:hypothetical protein